MTIEYRRATKEDAEVLVNIYNASFYDDYVRYGSCPGYGQTHIKNMSSCAIRNLSAVFRSKCWKREYMRLAACALFRSFREKD